jgi:hypothetical protein
MIGRRRGGSVALVVALLPLAGCFLFRNGDAERCQPGRIVVLGSQDDVMAFGGCKEASGVTIRTGATIDLTPLRELETIAGDLVIGPTVGIDEVALNGLVHVGGAVRVVDNPSLHGLFLPRLEGAGRIAVERNVSLTTIAVPRLAAVDGAIVLSDNRGLELVTAPELVTVGHELVILDHPALSLVQMGKLASAEAVRIEGDPKLPAAVVEELRSRGEYP